MQKIKISGLIVAGALLSGCAAKQEITSFEGDIPNSMCIAHHEEVRPGFLTALEDALYKNGINSQVVSATYVKEHGEVNPKVNLEELKSCPAVLFYTAHWNWDLALYMSYANIWITDSENKNRLAQASYISRHGLDKFIDAEEKVHELVDSMVGSSTLASK
ncbi:Sbal_3080 family lipoprotein [Alteromonas ponticola]|uniref:Sbal_3080 family lipoprotein n=1 Tax=Alteromonas aquimaris TaxID=2998417 RepID=A0ABT3P9A5_9ALTE|nr:Sbal_3080 family lipoprotein [Alteromonas aquimaris]MCW8109295.1 Sbal_3080 family lipoprotein [Alteromonas aquimaris]